VADRVAKQGTLSQDKKRTNNPPRKTKHGGTEHHNARIPLAQKQHIKEID
jgi:hypothetical protein